MTRHSRETLIEMAIEFFLSMNDNNAAKAVTHMAENCKMHFAAAKYIYPDKAAIQAHLQDTANVFETINFHKFHTVADVEDQSVACRFHVELTNYDGETTAMKNSNWFMCNDEGLFEEILIFNSGPLKEGFEVGSVE
jgi:hypothetical protein